MTRSSCSLSLRVPSRRVAGRRDGFTLIELGVVVALVALISAILLPAVMKMRDRAKKKALAKQEEQVQARASERGSFAPPQGAKPVIEQADLDMTLSSSYHRIGTKIYTRYEVRCEGKLTFLGDGDDPVLLFVPFPKDTTEARDVSLTFTSPPDGEPQKPDNVMYHQRGIHWSGVVPKGERIMANVAFVALGRERFEYDLPPARQLRSIDVSLALEGGGATKVPDHALQPTEIGKGRLGWQFTNLVSDRSIIIEIPGAQSPIGRVMLLCRLVAVAVLLFGAGFWYLSEQVKPGQLDDFRWGHFLLLALTYSLFFVIFAVIVFHGSIGTAPAMVVSAVFSFPLLLLHASRIIDLKFASTRVLPLAVFALGLVVNGVYGGGARDYVFIAAAIVVLGYLTVTYLDWSEAREAYRKQRRGELEERLESLKAKLSGEGEELAAGLLSLNAEAERMLRSPAPPELTTERCRLERAREPVEGILGEPERLTSRISTIDWDDFHFEIRGRCDSIEREIGEFITRGGQILANLTAAMRGELEGRAELMKTTLSERTGQLVSQLQAANATASRLLKKKDPAQLKTPRTELQEARDAVSGIAQERGRLAGRIEALDWSKPLPALHDVCDSLDRDLAAYADLCKKALDRLRKATRALTERRALAKEEKGGVHCVACGAAGLARPYCSECGTPIPRVLTCRQCGEPFVLPVHLVDRKLKSVTVCCTKCGTKHEAVPASTFASPMEKLLATEAEGQAGGEGE